MATFDPLHVPPTALEHGGVEVLRAAIVEGGLHVSLRRAFDDPQAWGMVIADVARHAARIFAREADRGRGARSHPYDVRCRDGRTHQSWHHQRN